MVRFPLLLLVLCAAPFAGAGEKADRERKAKVALALAGQRAKPVPASAPAPHPAVPAYGTGYARAVEDNRPLVVFVNCSPWEVEGAVVAKTEGPFAGAAGPAVVVGFPIGGRLLIDATLTPDPEKVQAAVKSAQRKIEVPPKEMKPAAPRPLKWDV